jgi:hypothetical protein
MIRALRALALGLLLAPAVALAAAPKAVVLNPVVDVGPVTQGDDIVRDFKLQNNGDADLEVTEVKPSCGCAVASVARVIKPGRIGIVKVVISTGEFRGPIAKGVTVFTNDPAMPRIQFVIKANVRALVEVKPTVARLIVVQGERYDPVTLSLEAPAQPEFQVTRVVSPYPFLEARFRPASSEASGESDGESGEPKPSEWNVELTLKPDAPIGPMADFLVVTTNHPTIKTVKVPVSGFVRPPVAVVPESYDFGSRAVEEELPGAVDVKVLSTRPVHLGEAKSSVPGVQVSVEELEAGRHYNVVILLRPGLPKGEVAGTITVSTDSARYPTIEIPVTGTVL